MSIQLPISVQVLQNLRRGDVVWVHVDSSLGTADDSFLEALREAVVTELDEDVAVLITPTDLVSRVGVMSLQDLFTLRDILDRMIDDKSAIVPSASA